MTVAFDREDQEKLGEIFGNDDVYRAEVGFGADYAAPVDQGGEPHWPPLRPLIGWTERMGWENYGLDKGTNESDAWNYVDSRRDEGKPLPAAYLLAAHIADEGTEAMHYASDAFAEAQSRGDSWMRSHYQEGMPLRRLVLDYANWTLGMAEDNLIERVSQASQGSAGLLGSMTPAELV